MLNYIWVGMILISLVVGGATGRMEAVSAAVLKSSGDAVTICLQLTGTLALWLGMMKIAEQAGIVELGSRWLSPLVQRLFPSLVGQHRALGAVTMYLSANILGLGNAATPFGIKAMRELQALNRLPDTASDAQCTLLALATSGFTLIPASSIAFRVAAGARVPTDIVAPTLIATLASTIVAIMVDRLLRRGWKG